MKSGWVIKKLGELGTIVRGKGIRRNETVDRGLPCIRYGEIYTSYNYILDCPHSFVSKDVFARCPKIKEGDVVFTLTGENKDEIAKALAYLGKDEIAAGGDLAIWSKHGCDPKFLAYMMYAPKLIEAKARASNGDIIVHASVKKMQEIDIPLPPLSEQKRIVAKIDAAFEKIDKLKANAERNLKNAKELFQSALDEAMRPKPGWVEKRLGEVGPVCMCKRILKSETNESGGVPFYKIGTFGKTPNAYISEETYRRYRELYKFPRKGEILISAAGTIGRTVVYDGEPAYFQDSNIVWIANDETKVSNAYLQWYYKTSPWCVTKGATIPRLYNDNITSAAIAIPPIAEQRQIVKRLDFLAEKVKVLEQHYTRLIADCAEMRQSVLRDAFEGRL